jgi:hypothetical protein
MSRIGHDALHQSDATNRSPDHARPIASLVGERSRVTRCGRDAVRIARLAIVVLASLAATARADYLGSEVNRIFLDPASTPVVSNGYQVGDVVSSILETTPRDTGAARQDRVRHQRLQGPRSSISARTTSSASASRSPTPPARRSPTSSCATSRSPAPT